jgi:hypothetical protein
MPIITVSMRGDTRSRIPDIRKRRPRGTLATWSGDVVSSQVPVLAGRSCSCPLCAIEWGVMMMIMSVIESDSLDMDWHSVGKALLIRLVCVVGRSVVSTAAHCEGVYDVLRSR